MSAVTRGIVPEDTIIALMRQNRRIDVSGQIDACNQDDAAVEGIRNTRAFISHRLAMQGLVVFDDLPNWGVAAAAMADHMIAGGAVNMVGGKPRMLDNGMPDSRMVILPAAAAELLDTWHSSGLCGTGSGDMVVSDLFVPGSHSVSLMHSAATADGALYRFPTFRLLALGISVVTLGNARASLNAARAYVQDVVGQAWAEAAAGDDLSTGIRAQLRLAATHATRTSADVARSMYDIAGGDSVFLSSPCYAGSAMPTP